MKKTNFNYVDILIQKLEERSRKNRSYSLRAFARDLEISAPRLSQILSKKKGLSEKSAEKLISKLGLSSREAECFILSAKSKHSRSKKEKVEASLSLSDLLSQVSSAKKLKLEDIEHAYNWYHLAILELVELKDCEHSVDWFAKKLKLKKIIVKNALERLINIGWLIFENNIYRASFQESYTPNDIPSVAIKKYHEEILKKAEESLYLDDLHDREFCNMTLAFSKDQMTEAKEAIRLFQKQFAEKFYPKDEDKDSVYQLSVQLFRLDSMLETVKNTGVH
jgi:uncharacterized protein (TIGR02147 family)